MNDNLNSLQNTNSGCGHEALVKAQKASGVTKFLTMFGHNNLKVDLDPKNNLHNTKNTDK